MPAFPCSTLLALLTMTLALSAQAAPVDDARATAQPPAAQEQHLPLIRIHGSALKGPERRLPVDDIDRIALLVSWKILDPYKRADNRYTGIRLKDLVDALAPGATHVRMRAINDYITVFERREWETLPILLATRDGDSRMTVANKGPARVVYRQTRENEMAMQVHAPKWIWQVVDVEFQSR